MKKLMAEKRGLLARINDEKKESKRYTDAILIDAEKLYSYTFVLMEEAKEKKRQVHDNIHFYPMEYIANAYDLLFLIDLLKIPLWWREILQKRAYTMNCNWISNSVQGLR